MAPSVVNAVEIPTFRWSKMSGLLQRPVDLRNW